VVLASDVERGGDRRGATAGTTSAGRNADGRVVGMADPRPALAAPATTAGRLAVAEGCAGRAAIGVSRRGSRGCRLGRGAAAAGAGRLLGRTGS
jgi:hypothetical protein